MAISVPLGATNFRLELSGVARLGPYPQQSGVNDRGLHVHGQHRFVRAIGVGGEELQRIPGLADFALQDDLPVLQINPDRLFSV